jgi:maltooligosyltrehalose trehalohydrolase
MKKIGTYHDGKLTQFTVWAPLCESMTLHIVSPKEAFHAMRKDDEGYWHLLLDHVETGTNYFYQPNGLRDLPDPASHFQPDGVHGPSQVTNSKFPWTDSHWQPPAFEHLVMYELHVGTFTSEGTFEAAIEKLDYLVQLGINAIELMPVNQFPGERNWGYDGVYVYAVQHSYGGPEGLKKFVDACHQKGIAVFLDVVYNHIGPEGNYLSHFGPYFNKNYCTPWGDALNFDSEWSDGVRDYFAGNALYWFEQFHIDGLRCDAIHMVFDNGAVPFFEYVHTHVRQLEQAAGRSYYLVAESDLNSPRVITSPDRGGLGFDAQWLDDFHHALYTLLDKDGVRRYEDFGSLEQLAKAFTDGFVLTGDWVKFRKRKYGRSSAGVPGNRFVVFNQNHDQIGNRVRGERLSMLVDFERLKIAAAAVLLSPYVPMLFMGEEFGARTPFLYFVSHSDPELIEAVRKGRAEEFKAFDETIEPIDAQNEQTFLASKIDWKNQLEDEQRLLLEWHKELISIRKRYSVFHNYLKEDVSCFIFEEKVLMLVRKSTGEEIRCILNFSANRCRIPLTDWDQFNVIIDSRDKKWCAGESMPSLVEADAVTSESLSVLVMHRYFQ